MSDWKRKDVILMELVQTLDYAEVARRLIKEGQLCWQTEGWKGVEVLLKDALDTAFHAGRALEAYNRSKK